MAKKNKAIPITTDPEVIDCACLIHDVAYPWEYVEKLYNSLCRNLTPKVRLHVYTERHRVLPGHVIHHPLEDWPGVRGPKRSWWYKIQLFNPAHHKGPMIYFDLDTVIVDNIDWIWKLPTDRFWAVHDFKYLFRPARAAINSSVMWFDPAQWNSVYQSFDPSEIIHKRPRWHGDQDYISEIIPPTQVAYFDKERVRSWRWELVDGGYDFKRRKHNAPGTGTQLLPNTSIMIFHGSPKPHEVKDQIVHAHWK